jgi:signal transduction histidine kinase
MKAELITELFRTTQESVNNALKYSGATKILVAVNSDARAIRVTISDNGSGFDIEESSTGFGLENMNHRMNSIGGSYVISSVKNEGTTVTLEAKFS